jgi:cell surface protein SprA
LNTLYNFYFSTLKKVVFGLVILIGISAYSQEPQQNSDSIPTYSLGEIVLKNPNSIIAKYTYDPVLDRYVYTEKIGAFNINYPVILTPAEYQKLMLEESMKIYFKEKAAALSGRTEEAKEAQKNLLPNFYVNSSFFESIFGGNTIELIPQGSVEMDLGVLFTKQDNPALSPRNRSNFTFDFDQRIQVSLLGKVGTRLKVTANFDTESTFDFQNQVKLEYTPNEDDIIRKIEVGNISMPLNSSLITGAQSLFGVKTELQFGKTRLTAVFSEQRSQTRNILAQGGEALERFEVFALDYDENRHFFLSQFFRNQYNQALASYPFIRSEIQITRLEIWVTNRNSRTDNVRNIVAVQDIGESRFINAQGQELTTIGLDNPPTNFFNTAPNTSPDNGNNKLNPLEIGTANSFFNPQIRDISNIQAGFNTISPAEGVDFATLENARKLEENEYTLDTQLGYISLNQRLSNDEVIGVAFQYTFRGEVFQVGEFANDGIVGSETVNNGNGAEIATNTLVVKMLKSNLTLVSEPVWNLMMKNIYDLNAFGLTQQDFKLNILYIDPQPLNYITRAEGGPQLPSDVELTPLLEVFNVDKLDQLNDPVGDKDGNGVPDGDGFFDFLPGITVDATNGRIIFTTVEPFGNHLFEKLRSNPGEDFANPNTYNANQSKYVFNRLYTSTKASALENSDKNKFQLRGSYKSSGGDGIPLGAFNVPRGSVTVTAGGRTLTEGIDYTVNYQLGRVQILDESLKASNTPVQVSVENNNLFGQQTRRFSGINVEHQFNKKLLLGATLMNLNEKPLTQKVNLGSEPVNNTMFGINMNYATEVPFLTRLANKLPNIDTDVPSNLSFRGEAAFLKPGAPKATELGGEATTYIDDFEGAQTAIDIKSPLAWSLASAPVGFGGELPNNSLEVGFKRAKLSWYTIDPTFFAGGRPAGVSVDDISNNQTRRVFIDEIFPQIDLTTGQSAAIQTLDLAYYPDERGPYNYNPAYVNTIDNPEENWAGIMRGLSSTNFEQTNVEFIQFWVLDPFTDEGNTNPGGTLTFNLGNISEDILKDGKKQYENGLPKNDQSTIITNRTAWGIVPANQSLVYAFDTGGGERQNQDVGFDGLSDPFEASDPDPQINSIKQNYAGFEDPAADNYVYFLNREGSILERYRDFNGLEGNSPESINAANRGNTTQPDVEDINRDQTMNTLDAYFEYNIPIQPGMTTENPLITDIREVTVDVPNGQRTRARWIQFKIPVFNPDKVVGPIEDFRSVRFIRIFMNGFEQPTILRFGTLDLIQGDWRRFLASLDENDPNVDDDDTDFNVAAVNIQENEDRTPIPYVVPPGIDRQRLFNNNVLIRQNEQSLSAQICGLEPGDSRAVFKNVSLDMRQFKKLRMFLHAESIQNEFPLAEDQMIAFVRMGNDFTNNFYEIEIPLKVTPFGARDAESIWPQANEIDLSLSLLQVIKVQLLTNSDLDPTIVNFFNEVDLNPDAADKVNPLRIGIKGNPSIGDIRALMVGVRNRSSTEVCGEVWFNELRLTDLDQSGGWATTGNLDVNMADFMNVTATGRYSTIGFGAIDQTPNERSREDVQQYDLLTTINLGQLLPKKWGIQLPFTYGVSEEIRTPEYDPFFQDIKLDILLDNTEDPEERRRIERQAEDYTKRQSINFIGVRKDRTTEKKSQVYDVENLTFNFSYNEVNQRNFEIEEFLDQNVRTGVSYNYNFRPKSFEPFKNTKFMDKSAYWKLLQDINFNYLPSSISFNANFLRLFNKQKFREVDIVGIGLDPQFTRNFSFDWQYNINWNLSKGLRMNFTASRNNIIRDFSRDPDLPLNDVSVWDNFFDTGDPNRHNQSLGINYEIPINKIPIFKFIKANYIYTGDFSWQRGSLLFNSIPDENGDAFDLGNTIQNANTQTFTANLDMDQFYKYIKLVPKTINRGQNTNAGGRALPPRPGVPPQPTQSDDKPKKNKRIKTELSGADKAYNVAIKALTSVKRIQVNYRENNGTVLPGYLPSLGFFGTLKPSFGFVFGSQDDIRFEAAKKGYLTIFPEFNQQFSQVKNEQLDITASVNLLKDLTIDLVANRLESSNFTDQFNVRDDGTFTSLSPNTFGNFSISTLMIKTAFDKSTVDESSAFEEFRRNRIVIAQRLAGEPINPDATSFPDGYGPNNQAVMLPAFLSAFTGKDAADIQLGAFRDTPIPNWDVKYTGLMNFAWFKRNFKRFSLAHGYRSTYTINSFNSNRNFEAGVEKRDAAGNFLNSTLFTSINLVEQFSPLIRMDFELKNDLKILAEVRKDRALSLSFDNNLLTEIQGDEFILGVGYRIKDVPFTTNLGGRRVTNRNDLNMKADFSLRDNETIVRSIDTENNQTTAGQKIWTFRFTADYAVSSNFTTLFFYDHTFSEFAISTAFPQTTIRSGVTLRYTF